jgi:outer membrane immunogenic protein
MRYVGDLICIGATAALALVGAGAATADGARPYTSRASDLQGAIDWSGLYLGGQLGGGWSNVDWTQLNANYFDTLGPTVVGTNSDTKDSGILGGVFGGYNHQVGDWVFGLELAATATGADVQGAQASPFFPAIDTFRTQIDWLGTLAGRVGYAWDRWLVYGRGGWAGGDVTLTLNDQGALVRASKDTWVNGWTLGAGVEYRLWRCVALGLAYDYVELNLDGETVTCPRCGTGAGFGTPIIDSDIRLQSVMARVSFFMPVEGGSIPGR